MKIMAHLRDDPQTPQEHFRRIADFAKSMKPRAVYEWLVTKGYFPEPYVLPPCFAVTKHPKYGHRFFPADKSKRGKFSPPPAECCDVHFPKTEYTDRTFGIIDPRLHSDIACIIAKNWPAILEVLFAEDNLVCSYSFPIPPFPEGESGPMVTKSSRMIYEWIAMAENDMAAIAHKFEVLAKSDIKNFYPSVYTHSIPWALHGKEVIRKRENRHSYAYFGNELDKLFQSANDGCTNGIPIGPAVSDLVAEIVISGVDRLLSQKLLSPEAEGLAESAVIMRFKDDYRILAKSESAARSVLKHLQAALKEYRLELNSEKTQFYKLPDGIFREWVSQYHAANRAPKKRYKFRRFKEVYLSVVRIDQLNSSCGVIDRFLADLVTEKYELRLKASREKSLRKVVSLLLILGRLRLKAFPKILGILEAILKRAGGRKDAEAIAQHLEEYLSDLRKKEPENRYLIAWICYFLRANGMDGRIGKNDFKDPVIRAINEDAFSFFETNPKFSIFLPITKVSSKVSLLKHLDVFGPA